MLGRIFFFSCILWRTTSGVSQETASYDVNSTQRVLFTDASATSYYTTYSGSSCTFNLGGGDSTSCIIATFFDSALTGVVSSFSIDSSVYTYGKNTRYVTLFVPERDAQQMYISFSLVGINDNDAISLWALSRSYWDIINARKFNGSWCSTAKSDKIDIISLANPFNSNVFSSGCKRCSYNRDGSSCSSANCAVHGVVFLDNALDEFTTPAVDYGSSKTSYDASQTGVIGIYAPYYWVVAMCLDSGPDTASGSTLKSTGYRAYATIKSCTSGYYCPDGKYFDVPCPAGSYCPERSTFPLLCPFSFSCPDQKSILPGQVTFSKGAFYSQIIPAANSWYTFSSGLVNNKWSPGSTYGFYIQPQPNGIALMDGYQLVINFTFVGDFDSRFWLSYASTLPVYTDSVDPGGGCSAFSDTTLKYLTGTEGTNIAGATGPYNALSVTLPYGNYAWGCMLTGNSDPPLYGGIYVAAMSVPCPAGSYCPPGSSSSLLCLAGQFSNFAAKTCSLCPVGTTSTSGSSICSSMSPSTTVTSTRTPSSSLTPTPSTTVTNTRTPSSSSTPSNTITRTRTVTPSSSPTNTGTPSATPTQSSTSTKTLTASPTNTPSGSFTATYTPTTSSTSSSTPSRTLTGTRTVTPSSSPTNTNTPTQSSTTTNTLTASPTNTPSGSFTPTCTPTTSSTTSVTPTPSFSSTLTPTSSQTSSKTSSSTPSPTPLVCSPGFYFSSSPLRPSSCIPCPNGTFLSKQPGTLTACIPCSTGLVSVSNGTACDYCSPLYRATLAGVCEVCPAGVYCDGTSSDPCFPPEACAGGLQGCREGHTGVMCTNCQATPTRYYKSPSLLCVPCTGQVWVLLPALVALPLVLCLVWVLRGPYEAILGQLSNVVIDHPWSFAVLGQLLTRLSLLNRLSLVPFPAPLRWLFGVVGLLTGFNTASVGVDCVVPWQFEQKYWLVVGCSGGVVALLLLSVDMREMRRLEVPIRQWLVWDAVALLLPQVLQTSWEALTYTLIKGKPFLLSDPATAFQGPSHLPAYSTSIFLITILFVFGLMRYCLFCACCLNARWGLHFKREVKGSSPHLYPQQQQQQQQLTALGVVPPSLEVVDVERDVFNDPEDQKEVLIEMRRESFTTWVSMLSAASVILQMQGPIAPLVFLVVLWVGESLYLLSVWRQLQESFSLAPTLLISLTLAITYGYGMACSQGGQGEGTPCPPPVQDGVGYTLLVSYLGVIVCLLWRPCKAARPILAMLNMVHLPHHGGLRTVSTSQRVLGQPGSRIAVVCFKRVKGGRPANPLGPMGKGGGSSSSSSSHHHLPLPPAPFVVVAAPAVTAVDPAPPPSAAAAGVGSGKQSLTPSPTGTTTLGAAGAAATVIVPTTPSATDTTPHHLDRQPTDTYTYTETWDVDSDGEEKGGGGGEEEVGVEEEEEDQPGGEDNEPKETTTTSLSSQSTQSTPTSPRPLSPGVLKLSIVLPEEGTLGLRPSQQGVFTYISDLSPGGQGEAHGLRVGDKILSINGTPVKGWESLEKTTLCLREAARPVRLFVERAAASEGWA